MMSVLKGKGVGQQHNLDDFHDKESARAAAMGGNLYLEDTEEFAGHNNGANGSSSPRRPQQQAYQQQQPPPPYSHDAMQQQQYYAQQQQQYYDQQQYYAQQQQQHVASQPPPPYYPDPPSQQEQQQPAVVGVMYEKTGSKKSLFPGRASARGAALINSMRNLSLGVRNKQKGEVNDWEKQWDEDDDSEGEDESDLRQQQQLQSSMPLHQIRPGMDAGHSAPDSLLQAQQLASPSATQPVVANFVTPETQPEDLLSKPIGEDGVEWDTGAPQQQQPDANLKPNVQMFMPMLRVLGKGSFGKVKTNIHDQLITRLWYKFSSLVHSFRWYWYKNESERNVVNSLP